jgi:hypothetical protein
MIEPICRACLQAIPNDHRETHPGPYCSSCCPDCHLSAALASDVDDSGIPIGEVGLLGCAYPEPER